MSRWYTLTTLSLITLAIYLFVSAPPPLPDGEAKRGGRLISIDVVFNVLAKENDVVRALYTKEIVGAGKGVGLAFSESWRDEGVDAGPLPALFLREAASSVSRRPLSLGLFLGSDKPIASANLFKGAQGRAFEQMRETGHAQRFYAEDTKLHTAMYPDIASAQPCVSCHNAHPESPKSDWALGELMGATTWTYPKAEVPISEALALIRTVRMGFGDAYQAYLDKVKGFKDAPKVGERWPSEGEPALPSRAVFLERFEREVGIGTLRTLLSLDLGEVALVDEEG